jgi:hypothetical protein
MRLRRDVADWALVEPVQFGEGPEPVSLGTGEESL